MYITVIRFEVDVKGPFDHLKDIVQFFIHGFLLTIDSIVNQTTKCVKMVSRWCFYDWQYCPSKGRRNKGKSFDDCSRKFINLIYSSFNVISSVSIYIKQFRILIFFLNTRMLQNLQNKLNLEINWLVRCFWQFAWTAWARRNTQPFPVI